MNENQVVIALIGFAGIILAGNGIILAMMKRSWDKNDKVKELCVINNRVGKQLSVFCDTMENILDVQDMLVDVFHDKGVLNGNSIPIKEKLRISKNSITEYSRQIRADGLLYKGEVV